MKSGRGDEVEGGMERRREERKREHMNVHIALYPHLVLRTHPSISSIFSWTSWPLFCSCVPALSSNPATCDNSVHVPCA